MDPYYKDDAVTLYHGDCRDVLKTLPDASVDAVVTDPPYELGFMGRKWDNGGIAYDATLWAEVLRVLKPGGHLLSFGGTRTWHRLACAIEDVGFEVRDSIAWMYGSGFPKSLDVSKAIEKAAGAEREVVGERKQRANGEGSSVPMNASAGNVELLTAPATDAAKQWQGWGTALKPAFEPVVVARKPLIGTVAENVLTHGTGALNVDASRIAHDSESAAWVEKWSGHEGHPEQPGWGSMGQKFGGSDKGRWPANVILDEWQAAELDAMSGVTSSPTKVTRGPDRNPSSFGLRTETEYADCYGDSGGASRFFYTAKADSNERPRVEGVAHPTVKPLDLMRYLVRLITPPGGTVLEPFAGSGTTLEACIVEGFKCIGVEMTDEYLPLIVWRVTKPIETVMF